MPDGTWTVDTDQLGRMSKWFEDKAASAQASMADVKREVEVLLLDTWEGDSAEALGDAIVSWQLCGQALIDRLYALSTFLHEAQSAYVRASESVQQNWKEP
ncbi:MAG: WXG100 family type VII secretion target [Propionibacteriaceae bacterium]|jgi:uncharacterized protein YukE|nr:WXG100 family type VII secretion target [Propionibacteriaceae bacterium]